MRCHSIFDTSDQIFQFPTQFGKFSLLDILMRPKYSANIKPMTHTLNNEHWAHHSPSNCEILQLKIECNCCISATDFRASKLIIFKYPNINIYNIREKIGELNRKADSGTQYCTLSVKFCIVSHLILSNKMLIVSLNDIKLA